MSDSYTQLYIHLVWSTWNRQPFITEDIEPAIYRAIHAKARDMDCVVLAAGGYTEHAHVLLRFPTTRTLASIVRAMKGLSSYAASRLVPERSFQWQHGYGAFTLRESEVPIVAHYIQTQKQHHQQNSLIHDWEITRCSPDL